MRTQPRTPRLSALATNLDVWLWVGSLIAASIAAVVANDSQASPVLQFVTALAAIAMAATTMGRAVSQIGGRLSPGAVGTFEAVTGNLPELIIGTFALRHGLIAVVQGTIAGSVLNLLLFSNGLAFLAGGLRNGSMNINTERAQNTCVMLILMVATLIAPGVAVVLHTPAATHTHAVSYVGAIALLTVFVVALPSTLRNNRDDDDDGDDDDDPPSRPAPETARRWPIGLTLGAIALSGLMLAFEADWLTSALSPAIDAMHINAGFTGLFIIATVGNLSQIGPSVQLAVRGDADTAASINMEGALQVTLMLAPVFVLIAPLVGAGGFTLIFPPLQIVAVLLAALLVVFVIVDGEVNYLEGTMLTAFYVVLASLFWWS